MFSIYGNNISNFIKAHSKAVIATCDSVGQPSTSVIFYVIGDKDEMFFITKTKTAKYENLKLNNKASITIVDKDKPIAVNTSGTTTEITDIESRDRIMQEVFKISYGELHDYAPIIKLHKGSFTVLKFNPIMAKMTDFTKPLGEAKEDLKQYS